MTTTLTSDTTQSVMQNSARRAFLRRELTPTTRAVWLLLGLAVGLAVLMSLCTAVWGVRERDYAATLGALALFGLPFPILLIAIAAIVERKPLLRTVLFGAGGLLSLIAALLFAGSASFGPQQSDGLGASALALCMAVPVLLLFGAPTLYFGVKAPAHLRNAWAASRTDSAAQLLHGKGELTLEDAAQQLGVAPEEADQVLRQLAQDEAQAIRYYPEHHMAFTQRHEAERQRALVDTIAARGQVRLDELTFLFKISRELLHTWLVQLVSEDAFQGYINWQTGVLYSEDAAALGDRTICPQCGGRLQLSGRKLVLCSHCGAEVFL